jgi:hypothetical protein
MGRVRDGEASLANRLFRRVCARNPTPECQGEEHVNALKQGGLTEPVLLLKVGGLILFRAAAKAIPIGS